MGFPRRLTENYHEKNLGKKEVSELNKGIPGLTQISSYPRSLWYRVLEWLIPFLLMRIFIVFMRIFIVLRVFVFLSLVFVSLLEQAIKYY